ncbi:MAG: amidohydrolase, partial [Pyramidobacter sp.]|nr:amidohydrolase [Pyramidobacter sp.]
LAEYDALSGLSQQAFVAEPCPIPGRDTGHGCGHHLLGTGALAAALAVKAYIEDTGVGSVTLFGCPAEEAGGGKVYMSRDGLFKNIDASISWHPASSSHAVRTRPSKATNAVLYSFKGIAAHAGANPQAGRSALDAVELMNVGANFLREHMDLSCRLHYAILDTGGSAPNVVQDHAVVKYLIRGDNSAAVRALRERVDKIAQGAALMTETDVEIQIIGGCSNILFVPTLQTTADEALRSLPVPVPTEEELAFAETMRATMALTPAQKAAPPFPDAPAPMKDRPAYGGSTDTSDVSWVCPLVQFGVATWCRGTGGHTWQAVAQGKSTFAHKATRYAGKLMAKTAMLLLSEPERLEQAKKEHKKVIGDGYVCPIPGDLQPAIKPRT